MSGRGLRATGGATPEAVFHARILGPISAIDAAQWDACAGADNPFLSHALLSALEDSGSAVAETGWLPQHIVIEGDGAIRGAAPLYIKSHSFGEYVFDHGWGSAYERAGGRYYPKLLSAVPFTPVPGPRLLGHGPDAAEVRQALLQAMIQIAERHAISSLHINFTTAEEWRELGDAGLLLREGLQFHWHNRDYGTFEDFLGDLATRKRKAIRKERRAALADGLTVTHLIGADITEAHWDAFFDFYMDTGGRKWGRPYLTRSFFSLLGERLSGRAVAGALNLIGTDTLYGRYWGCMEDHRFLHFELCYYQALDYAIAHGLARVEAGAQGPHKLQRGYLPVPTYSAHWVGDAGFRTALARYLVEERAEVAREIAFARRHSPFRRDGDASEP